MSNLYENVQLTKLDFFAKLVTVLSLNSSDNVGVRQNINTMGFLERFKAARSEQQETKGLQGADTAGKEAEARGQQTRESAGEYLAQKSREAQKFAKDVIQGAKDRAKGLWNKITSTGSTIRRGVGSALDRAIGTPGLVMDIASAGKQAAGETITAGTENVKGVVKEIGSTLAENLPKVAGDVEGMIRGGVKRGSETLQGIATGIEGGATELVGAASEKAKQMKDAILLALQSALSPERLMNVNPDNIEQLANTLVMQGVDAASDRGKQIVEGIKNRWDKGVGKVVEGAGAVLEGFGELTTVIETKVTDAKDRLVDRAVSAKNKFMGWWNKSRIQEARINNLEQQNAELVAKLDHMNALLDEMAAARKAAPKRARASKRDIIE